MSEQSGEKSERRHPNVLHLDEVTATPMEKGTRFGATMKLLGRAAGGRGVGASWYEIPAGKTAFPMHWHSANEEAIFVLEGRGKLRMGSDTVAVRAGDWVTFPPGPEHAHQLINDGDTPLRYLCMSTLLPTEICGYPDSGKIAAMSFGPDRKPWLRALYKTSSEITDYWEDEKID